MKILVTEFITGGGFIGEELPEALLQEGRLMLSAIVSDLVDVQDTVVSITLDHRCHIDNLPNNITVKTIKSDYVSSFRSLCEQVDAVLVIAPESDNNLELLSQIVVDSGKLLLGSSPSAINLAASKYQTAKVLAEHKISVIETYHYNENFLKHVTDEKGRSWVVKPDNGVGCEGIVICDSSEQIKCHAEKYDVAIVQPFLAGIPASISILCHLGECIAIGYNGQKIKSEKNALSLVGIEVNALTHLEKPLLTLAGQVCRSIPELSGYVGLDVIIMDDSVILLEINPRLTTSYVGLKASINANPAVMLLEMLKYDVFPKLDSTKFKKITVKI